MSKSSVAARVAVQEKAIQEAQQKLEKIKTDEARRLLKIFDSVGFFDAEISDAELKQALQQLVQQSAAGNPTSAAVLPHQ